MEQKIINISKDFNEAPAGRYHPQDGDWTGELFRNDILIPNLKKYKYVVVNLDNSSGYGSSFIDEAFGGLVREGFFTKEYLRTHLIFTAPDENMIYVDEARKDIENAKEKK